MTALVLYELDPDVRARLGLTDVAVPVRKDRAWEIFQGSTVHLDRLLVEVNEVVGDDPEFAATFGPFLARLARIAVSERARSGSLDEAIRLCDIGLKYSPGSLRLWTAKAMALQAAGQLREASAAYRRVAWNPEFDGSPITLLMAARAAFDLGEPESALEFLRLCPATMLRAPEFREMVEACGGRIPDPEACSNCGREQDEGFEFCPKCGTPVKRF